LESRAVHLVIIPGTNRAGALSLTLARHVAEQHRSLGASVDLLALNLGPEFLAPEAYRQPSAGITSLVSRFLAADGVVFVVPEYNGSYPGVLKLFIDMLPYPQGFDRRPCAFIGLAAGQFQGLRAVEHLQGVTGYRHAFMYPNRVFIGSAFKQFTPEGALVDAELDKRLLAQATGFQQFIRGVKPQPS
jgi:chromate reductase